MTWADFKELVKELLSDGQRNDTAYALAAAEYVKAKFAREANQDLATHDSYYRTYTMQRVRLLGYAYAGSTLLNDVTTLIGVDGKRNPAYLSAILSQAQADIEGLSPTVDGLINQAVMDVQSAVPLYRSGQSNTFLITDLTLNGRASQGNLPTGAQVRDANWVALASGIAGVDVVTEGSGYTSAQAVITGDGTGALVTPAIRDGKIVGYDINDKGKDYTTAAITVTGDGVGATGTVVLGVNEIPLRPWDWSKRDQLISGHAPINNENYYLCIDPYAKTFLVFPPIDDMHKVVMAWDGLKDDFADGDTVPFDDPVAKAVAEYVRGHLALSVTHDQATYAVCMKPVVGTYYVARRRLFIDAQDRTRMRNA